MYASISRRQLLQAGSLATGLAVTSSWQADCSSARSAEQLQEPFGYCLNTSTIRGQELSLEGKVEICARAGYQGIEPWMGEIQKYVESGKTLKDLKARIADAGLSVESAIGFAPWIVDDPQQRVAALETARRDMEMLQAIGGKRIAAPPVGATKQADLDLSKAAERYGDLVQIGQDQGITPQLELWGFSATLSRLGEVALVAIESGQAGACLLLDVYHIYKGGSDFSGLRLIDGGNMHVLHINDYPGDIGRDKIGDGDRVFPGDGDAPLGQILKTLYQTGFRGMLSLELFNRKYWEQDPLEVARKGLMKTQEAVRQALA